MAKPIPYFLPLLLLSAAAIATAADEHSFVQSVSPASKPRRLKLSHLRFFWHDIISGRDPTAVSVALPSNTSSTFFGGVIVIDDPMTVGPDPSSRLVGRAQGLYAMASKEELVVVMSMNLVFTEGKYSGSSLAVVGRNRVMSAVREMPVVGGSGLFRHAQGYCLLHTNWMNNKGDAIVEYNVYVTHY